MAPVYKGLPWLPQDVAHCEQVYPCQLAWDSTQTGRVCEQVCPHHYMMAPGQGIHVNKHVHTTT